MPDARNVRQQRRMERRARSALRAMAIATTAAAILAVTMPQGNEATQAAPDHPVAAEVASPRPPSDPPASGVLTPQIELQEEDPAVAHRRYLDLLKRLDDERALDIRIQECFRKRLLSIQDILRLTYYVSLADFLRCAPWPESALMSLRYIQGVTLFAASRATTAAGEDIWSRFRHRIRREGAHMRIFRGTIRFPKQHRPTHRAA